MPLLARVGSNARTCNPYVPGSGPQYASDPVEQRVRTSPTVVTA